MKEFYWYGNVEGKNKLKSNLLELEEVREIRIATAYFSEEGIEILSEFKEKYKLKSTQIYLYLASDFSLKNPGKLLKELMGICKVKIIFNIRFHPKVYWLKAKKENRVMFGSSNLTKGGFEKNLEFDIIKTTEKDEEEKLKLFFKFCDENSDDVDQEIIHYYEKNNEEIKKLKSISSEINKRLMGYKKQKDAFGEDEYNLDDRYFKYEDYEVLFIRNQKENTTPIRKQREITKNKLLKIHNEIYGEIKKEELHCHWKADNITSQIVLTEFNGYCIDWIGIRYGKTRDEVEAMSGSSREGKNPFGFQKHACLQFLLGGSGFEINLFHAVKHNAVDRDDLRKNIDKKSEKIIQVIETFKNENLVWKISNEDNEFEFKFDKREAREFIEFYKTYDKEGYISRVAYILKPDDGRLKNIETISEVVKEKIKLLNPLYKLVAWRGKNI